MCSTEYLITMPMVPSGMDIMTTLCKSIGVKHLHTCWQPIVEACPGENMTLLFNTILEINSNLCFISDTSDYHEKLFANIIISLHNMSVTMHYWPKRFVHSVDWFTFVVNGYYFGTFNIFVFKRQDIWKTLSYLVEQLVQIMPTSYNYQPQLVQIMPTSYNYHPQLVLLNKDIQQVVVLIHDMSLKYPSFIEDFVDNVWIQLVQYLIYCYAFLSELMPVV